ncbi:MAG: hypothetical protein LBU32_01865 [Clostridiales bacterium]|nr:hypothetical protein [Clostridiales bacterium]
MRECVLFRDGHKCPGRKNCKNPILNVHHIETRKIGEGAPNSPAALCEDCRSGYRDAAFMGIGMPLSWASGCRFHGHRDAAFMGIGMPLSWASGCRFRHHAGKLKLNLKKGRSFKDAAFMGMRWAFCNRLREECTCRRGMRTHSESHKNQKRLGKGPRNRCEAHWRKSTGCPFRSKLYAESCREAQPPAP